MNEQIKPVDFIGPPAEAALPEVHPAFERLVRKSIRKKLITTLALTSETCRWPIGDPTESDFHYCGQLPLNGRPYCDTHNSMSYQSARRKNLPFSRES